MSNLTSTQKTSCGGIVYLLRRLFLLFFLILGNAYAEVVVIGHANLTKLNKETIEKVFTGKMIEVGGGNVVAVNLPPGNPARTYFFKNYLNKDEEKYTGYWIVRRYIGKGVPPKEVADSMQMINFVQSTPGAIGYIEEADLKPGLNVLLRSK